MSENTGNNIAAPGPVDDGEGWAKHMLIKVFGRSYKTSIAGLLAFVGAFPLLIDDAPHWLVKAGSIATALAMATGLMMSKATGVTGAEK